MTYSRHTDGDAGHTTVQRKVIQGTRRRDYKTHHKTPCNKHQLDALFILSSVYFVNQPLHISDIFLAHHHEVYCTYIQLVRVVLFI